jgi:hypothetical protein
MPTRPAFIPPKPPAATSTIREMAATAYRVAERRYRERAGITEWGDREMGFTLRDEELAGVLREANEARAELRAGASLAEALERAARPADRLGEEDPPVAPWFEAEAPGGGQETTEGDGDETDAPGEPVENPEPMHRTRGPALRKYEMRHASNGAGVLPVVAHEDEPSARKPSASILPSSARTLPAAAVPQPAGIRSYTGPAAAPAVTELAEKASIRDTFLTWLAALEPAGATRAEIVAAGVLPLKSLDAHLASLQRQGRIIREMGGRGGSYHVMKDPIQRTPTQTLSFGNWLERRDAGLRWIRDRGTVTRADMVASGIWKDRKSVDNACQHWQIAKLLVRRPDDRFELGPRGIKILDGDTRLKSPSAKRAEARREPETSPIADMASLLKDSPGKTTTSKGEASMPSCVICKKPGHNARTCPQKGGLGRSKTSGERNADMRERRRSAESLSPSTLLGEARAKLLEARAALQREIDEMDKAIEGIEALVSK